MNSSCGSKVGNLPSGVDVPALTALAEYSAGNGTYNGLCLVNQKAVVLDAAALAATHNEYPIDQHKTVLAGVTGTHQWLPTGQPTDVNGYSLKYAATSTASGQLGSKQIVEDYLRYAGQEVTRSRWVKSNSANARLVIDDGVTKTSSDPHTGGGGWELLTVTTTIGASPTKLECYAVIASAALADVSIATGDYIEFTDARLDFGGKRLSGDREFAEELALCQRYYWRIKSNAIGTRVVTGGVDNATTSIAVLVPPVALRSAPTLSYSSLLDWTLLEATTQRAVTGLVINTPIDDNTQLWVNVNSTGMTVGNTAQLRAANTDAYLAFSAEL